MMVEKKVSDRNQEVFPISIFLSLSLWLYDLNKNISIYYNQVCELIQTRWSTRKRIEGIRIALIVHLRVPIFEEILLFMLLHKFIGFGFIDFIVFHD